ncbi:MAG: YigZ family protein [Bacteroidia bacterium]|nr:YigZ family protein [Bacteroidia bacterium]
MKISDSYKTIKSASCGIYKEKGSKFISEAYQVTDESEIKIILENVRRKYHEAKHHSYAYLLGNEGQVWRTNDDGEPSGTAGKPIMGQIRSFGLTNVLIIVSRYFGGTLLGVSGLINAYRSAAESALSNAEIIDHIIHEFYEITYPYTAMNDVMKIVKEENIIQSEHNFDLECRIIIDFRSSAKERIIERFSRIEGLNYRFLSAK